MARPEAEYVTTGGKEIVIRRDDNWLWYATFYNGGRLPGVLSGTYSTKQLCHNAVVAYLRSDDILGKAKWPGK